ncbi:MAG: hypothetical protein JWN67_4976 [Actinomycetia bacterium]|nr:hypothetical protein [Actinomycetes bacterium]
MTPSRRAAAHPLRCAIGSCTTFRFLASFRATSDIQPPQPGRHGRRLRQEAKWPIAEQDPTRGRTSPRQGAAPSPATATTTAAGARSAATLASLGRSDGHHTDYAPYEDREGAPTGRGDHPRSGHRRNEDHSSVTNGEYREGAPTGAPCRVSDPRLLAPTDDPLIPQGLHSPSDTSADVGGHARPALVWARPHSKSAIPNSKHFRSVLPEEGLRKSRQDAHVRAYRLHMTARPSRPTTGPFPAGVEVLVLPGFPDREVELGEPGGAYPSTTLDVVKRLRALGLTVDFLEARSERREVTLKAHELWIPVLQVAQQVLIALGAWELTNALSLRSTSRQKDDAQSPDSDPPILHVRLGVVREERRETRWIEVDGPPAEVARALQELKDELGD